VFKYLKRAIARHDVVRPRRSHQPPVEPDLCAGGAPGEGRVAPPPASPHRVEVLLNQAEVYAHPGDGYEPLSGYVTAIEFTVDAVSSGAACEVAYGVTNSYPWELHCEPKYLDVVRTYREVGHFRSVTAGDMLVVDEERFVCSHFGFSKSPWINGFL
jgi:hypothetical protein